MITGIGASLTVRGGVTMRYPDLRSRCSLGCQIEGLSAPAAAEQQAMPSRRKDSPISRTVNVSVKGLPLRDDFKQALEFLRA